MSVTSAEPVGREAKKRATRQRIYEVGLNLFRARGYDDVSVNEITELAGTAKGTFFNYFATKADLLAAWYEDVHSPVEADPKLGPQALTEALLNAQRTLVEAEPRLLEAKFALEGQNEAIVEAERRTDRHLRELFSESFELHYPDHPIPASSLADLMLSTMTGAAREWRGMRGQVSLTSHVRRRVSVLMTLIGGVKS